VEALKYIVVAFFFIQVFVDKIDAQDKVKFIEAGLGFSQPAGAFNAETIGLRFSGDIAYIKQLRPNQPLFWGLHSYYFTLGNRTGTFERPFDFVVQDFFYSTTSNVWGNNLLLRFYPDVYLGNIELFVEAHLGFKYLFTVTSTRLDSSSDVSEYLSDSHSLSISYGATFGLQYPISNQWYVRGLLGYFPGISASYYVRNNDLPLVDSTIDGFDLRRGPTDVFRFSLGVTYRY